MNNKQEVVYNYIKKHKPEKNVDISEGTGLRPSDVHYALKALQDMGKVDYIPARFEIRK